MLEDATTLLASVERWSDRGSYSLHRKETLTPPSAPLSLLQSQKGEGAGSKWKGKGEMQSPPESRAIRDTKSQQSTLHFDLIALAIRSSQHAVGQIISEDLFARFVPLQFATQPCRDSRQMTDV